ncbi:MAG TPA: CHAT domain-containing protein [Kofleriaceae bacterium]|nr:CHAT domain-containing protein [Kofleriaceae bacterium]
MILFLAADPRGLVPLRLGDECAAIQRELSMAPHRDDFRLEPRWAVGVDELIRHLSELHPTVLHISGHGGGSSGLTLQDEHGQPQRVSTEALLQIVDAAARNLRVAVLNACYSAEQAEALRSRVDCVVGMTGAVGDDPARRFATRFYGALGNRCSVGEAVAHGIAALSAQLLPDGAFPRCVTRDGIDANAVVLGPPPSSSKGTGDEPRSPGARRRNAFAGLAVLGIPATLWRSPADPVASATAAPREAEPAREPASRRRGLERDTRLECVTPSRDATHAVQYQHALLNEFGIAVSEDELVREAIDNHLYLSSTGMHLDDIGRQIEAHGIALHREPHAHAFHLANELAQGHKVLIGFDPHEPGGDHWIRHSLGRELGFGHGGPAIVMCQLDTSDPAHPGVVVADPGTGAAGTHYALPEFLEAWRGCSFSLVATADPCPRGLPEMAHFDYRTGHIAMIGDAPYELAHACCAAAEEDSRAHAIADLESQFLCTVDGHGDMGPGHGFDSGTGLDLGHVTVGGELDVDPHGDELGGPIDPDHFT